MQIIDERPYIVRLSNPRQGVFFIDFVDPATGYYMMSQKIGEAQALGLRRTLGIKIMAGGNWPGTIPSEG